MPATKNAGANTGKIGEHPTNRNHRTLDEAAVFKKSQLPALYSYTTVSYTHLDVYKRQVSIRPGASWGERTRTPWVSAVHSCWAKLASLGGWSRFRSFRQITVV